MYFIISTLIFVILMPSIQHGRQVAASATQSSLPAGLDSNQERMDLFEKIKDLYNNKNYEQLYSMLDEAAQIQVDKETFPEQVEGLHELVGNIESGAYSHYEFRVSSGVKEFILYYVLKVTKGTKKAKLTISIAQQNDEPYRIYGFHLSTSY
jgi:hypothetical protein